MKLHSGVVVVVSLLALAGCASLPSGGGKTFTKQESEDQCTRNKCTIDVGVIDPEGDCKVYLKPTTLVIAHGNHGSDPDGVEIEWDLDNQQWHAGWAFVADNGVAVRGDGQFKNKGRSHDKRKYTWTDTNSDAGPHVYVVQLYNTETGKSCSQDPTIVNQG